MSRVFQRSGSGSWWIDFSDAQGIRHRRKIGPSKRVAKEVLDGILGSVARCQHLGIVAESAVSFNDFAELWKQRVTPTLRPHTQTRWFGIIENHLKPLFVGALRSITSSAVEGYAARRLEAGANPQTVNRELSVLRHMIKRAVRWEYLTRDPVGTWPFSKETSFGRARFLTEEEIPRLLAACEDSRSPYLKAFVIVALNSGMRRGEILSLTRKSIDWQNSSATLELTKNGDTRHVPLNSAAVDALRSLPARLDGGRLFPFKDDHSVSRAFRRAVERANIEDFRLHDLRHTFASYHAMAGVQGRGLQSLLGHRDARMTMRYSHLSDGYLRAAVDSVVLGAAAPAERPAKAK
ncbi:MAG: tyrosine-type recombinase/integrase [Candidatus Binatus sp.]